MPFNKIDTAGLQADAVDNTILDLADNFAFTGTITGASTPNTPAFSALLGFNQSQTLTDNVDTKITFNTEDFDTDSAFDHSSNYRFTVPSGKAGKYFFYYWVYVYGGSDDDLRWINCRLYKNGSNTVESTINVRNDRINHSTQYVSHVFDLSEGDYIQVYAIVNSDDGSVKFNSGSNSRFGGFRLT